MQVFKFYQYNLKKIFTKSPRFWVILALMLTWWFLIPYFIFTFSKENTIREIKNLEVRVYQNHWNDNTVVINGQAKIINDLTFKEFCQWRLNCQEIKQKRTVLLALIADTEKEIVELSTNSSVNEEKLKKKRSFQQNLKMLESSSFYGFFSLPFNGFLVDFFCHRPATNSSDFFKLVNNISTWSLSGWLASNYLLYWIIDFLFLKPKETGEEMAVLTLVSPISRAELFLGKILANLTFFYVYCLLTFALPFLIYYWWIGANISWGALGLLTLWSTILVPLTFFGLFLCPYLFLVTWKKWVGTVFTWIITFFSSFWALVLYQLTPVSWFPKLIKMENWFFQPSIFFGLGLLTGTIFLTLYYFSYKKEDIK